MFKIRDNEQTNDSTSTWRKWEGWLGWRLGGGAVRVVFLVVFILLANIAAVQVAGQSTLKIREGTVTWAAEGRVRFQFEGLPGEGRVGDFVVESTGALGPDVVWERELGVVMEERAPGLFMASIPSDSLVLARFYRVLALASAQAVFINELMSQNTSVFADGRGDYWDWLELYNPGDTAVNLQGYSLTDDPSRASSWIFPEVLLQPGGYLVVYASGADRRETGEELHLDFRLNDAGEQIVLMGPDGRPVDEVTLSALGANESLGRDPDPNAAGVWTVYSKANATPGKANASTSVGPPLPVPEFSIAQQFHASNAVVNLVISSEMAAASIHFTTNGSPVSAGSPIYIGPVVLDRTTVVRARIYFGSRGSVERVRTYFFGVAHELPVISLSTASTNMEFRNGYLYGMGSSVLSASGQVLQNYPYSGSNAWREREVEASFEFFETDRKPRVNQRLGVRIFGGWGSRGYPQKSLALFARQEYGEGKIRHRFFPEKNIDAFESLVLRNSGNDNQSTHQTPPRPPVTQFGATLSYGSYFVNGTFTLLRDALMQRLARDLDVETQGYRPAVVYINGDYWGLYNIREKINENYVVDNHDVDKGQVDVIEGYGSVMAGDSRTYTAMRNFVGGRDLKVAANFSMVEENYIEIDNFIDYHLAVIYNQNFDIGNIKCWRPRGVGGRFRWILYDQDYGFHLWPEDVYVPAMARDYADYANMFRFYTASVGTGTGWPNEGGRTLLLRRLLLNDGFKQRFITRCADLLNGPFREDLVLATIDSMAGVIRGEMPRHLRQWSWTELQARGFGAPHQKEFAPFVKETWEAHLGVLRQFARQRPAQLRRDCIDHFRLSKGTGELTVLADPSDGGRLRINTSVAETFPWTGTFFREYPVGLTAIPKPGFLWVGWEGPAAVLGAGATPEDVNWHLDLPEGGSSLTARFIRNERPPPESPEIVISEFQYHPAPDRETGDWIELHNPGTEPVDISGWIVRDEQDSRELLLPVAILPAGGYGVLCEDLTAFTRAYPAVTNKIARLPFGLGNGNDTLRLYRPDGTLILSLRYRDEAPWDSAADGTGRTLQLIDSKRYSGAAEAWRASSDLGGTPGRANPSIP